VYFSPKRTWLSISDLCEGPDLKGTKTFSQINISIEHEFVSKLINIRDF